MIPHERSLVKELAGQPFALIGVNSEDTPDNLRRMLKEQDVTWPSFFDGGGTSGPIATRWGVSGWPTIYVIDQKGIIRDIGARGEELTKAVKDLLAKKP